MARHLLGLEDVISVDIVDGQNGAVWTVFDGTSVSPWKDRPDDNISNHRPSSLGHQDKYHRLNYSWTIIKTLSTAFTRLGKPSSNSEEKMHDRIDDALLNGIYEAGLGLMKNDKFGSEAVLAARDAVYRKLAKMDELILRQRFLMGDKLTAPDLRLVMTLFC